jgi:hypothetical protein
MYSFNQNYLVEHIEQIISSSYYGDELFFTDYKKAAINILRFLESENALLRDRAVPEINSGDQRRAA